MLLDVTRACSLRDCFLGPGPEKVADSGLISRSSLALAFSSRGHWFRLALAEVAGFGLLMQKSLAQT